MSTIGVQLWIFNNVLLCQIKNIVKDKQGAKNMQKHKKDLLKSKSQLAVYMKKEIGLNGQLMEHL